MHRFGCLSLWAQMLVVLSLSVVSGAVLHVDRVVTLFCPQSPAVQTGSVEAGLQPVERDGAVQWLYQKRLIVDARTEDLFRQGHLPTARSVPVGDSAALARLRACCLAQQVVLVYCDGWGCDEAFLLAESLLGIGFSQVRVYEAGFSDWRDAGLRIEVGP
ncbi:MAG: rhodanese-like domain-containing protein [Desulfuromonadaceae bacterium]|nr:rhodanese-like domain-containing protein [Desulfuromonadaceae bacterium]